MAVPSLQCGNVGFKERSGHFYASCPEQNAIFRSIKNGTAEFNVAV